MTIKRTTFASLTALTLALGANGAFAANDMTSASMSQSGSQSTSSEDHTQDSSNAQGVYSTSHLVGASVYAQDDSKNAIGKIGDVLLGNDMSVKQFVIETSSKLGVGGGKSYVVSPSDLSVETLKSKHASKPQYKATLDMTRDQLTKNPVYSDSWWSNAHSQASDAWHDTKKSAKSAWTHLKSTTSNIMSGASNQADEAKDSTQNAADKATDSNN